jgi:D-alanine-D-alanine ligase
MNIAVLFGGISSEREVSINGGKAVVKALTELGHNVLPIDPALGKNSLIKPEIFLSPDFEPTQIDYNTCNPKNLIDCINSELFDNVDCAFIVLHGKYGEDGRIQALLELRGIPYTASGVKASANAIDKNGSKMLFLAAGIPTPAWVVIHPKDYENHELFDEIRKEMGGNLVIKPNEQGSTIGITIIEDSNLDEIQNAVLVASEYCETVLIERYIEGRELTVGIIGDEALPIIEIVPEDGFYDYEHKYTKGRTEYICPAELTEDIQEFTQTLAMSAYNVLGCSGFARADFRLNEEGQSFLLEVNTIPGFTALSLVPMAAAELGIEFPELCERIIELGIEEHSKNKKSESGFSELDHLQDSKHDEFVYDSANNKIL